MSPAIDRDRAEANRHGRAAPRLSALVVARDEEARLPACLARLQFCDEIVVVLDRTGDESKPIAHSYGARVIEGIWELEGRRRAAGQDACSGDWVLEIDADEHVPPELAHEVRTTIETSRHDWHLVPVLNHIGERPVRFGWGASFGVARTARLYRRGIKSWGHQRVHPGVDFDGREGPILSHAIAHLVDRNISDMLRRLDAYSTARAMDLRDRGLEGESLRRNLIRFLSRFYKCYVRRRGFREGRWGLLIAILAGLYPLLSYFKATLEDGRARPRPQTSRAAAARPVSRLARRAPAPPKTTP